MKVIVIVCVIEGVSVTVIVCVDVPVAVCVGVDVLLLFQLLSASHFALMIQ